MSVAETRGVLALALIVQRVSQGDAVTVAQLAREQGLARSTCFNIVARLEDARLIGRDVEGKLAPGPGAVALGFAAFGLAPLQGPAEALLTLLHERTGAGVELVAQGVVIVARGMPQPAPDLDSAIQDGGGTERARLRLAWRPEASRADRAWAGVQFERTRTSLEYYLNRDLEGA